MKGFKEFLYEIKYLDVDGASGKYTIYKNPTTQEFDQVYKSSGREKSVRGLVYKDDVYIFPGVFLHNNAMLKLMNDDNEDFQHFKDIEDGYHNTDFKTTFAFEVGQHGIISPSTMYALLHVSIKQRKDYEKNITKLQSQGKLPKNLIYDFKF